MNLIEINQNSNEYKMLDDNILVELKELASNEDVVSESGIIIQTANNNSEVTDRNTNGRVVAVGKDVKDIKVDDFVFWHITSGIEVKFRDGYFMVISESRILGCSK